MPFLKQHKKITRSQILEEMTKRQGLRHAIFNVVHDKYIGEWDNDVKTGKGMMYTRLGQLYEGDFLRGYRHGFGVLANRIPNKTYVLEYRGGWKWGKMCGYGMRRYMDGGTYYGYWKNGKRDGYGQMFYPNGEFYAGDWVQDVRQGMGMLVRVDVNRYEGQWYQDVKHGKGIFLHLDSGQLQRGVWTRDTCVFSTMMDIKFRQSARIPTPYPIQKIHLNTAKICAETELKALQDLPRSCLSLHFSDDTDDGTVVVNLHE